MIAIASALVLALAPAAGPAAQPKKPPANEAAKKAATPEASSAVTDATQGAEKAETPAAAKAPAATAADDRSADQDLLGFMSLTKSTASRDGAVKLPWEGPGGPQLKLSWDALDKRNEALSMGDMMARSLIDAVHQFYESEGGLDPEAMKQKLKNMVGGPMEEARESYLDALTWEERRLFFVEKAIALAQAEMADIPGVDADLVARRLKASRSGALKKAVIGKVDGYRDLALGLVAYLEGDNFGALQKVRNAAQALPDLAVAHAFLGSMYFLFDQKDAAVAAWRRAYELDPSNKAVAEALKEYGRPNRQSKK